MVANFISAGTLRFLITITSFANEEIVSLILCQKPCTLSAACTVITQFSPFDFLTRFFLVSLLLWDNHGASRFQIFGFCLKRKNKKYSFEYYYFFSENKEEEAGAQRDADHPPGLRPSSTQTPKQRCGPVATCRTAGARHAAQEPWGTPRALICRSGQSRKTAAGTTTP